MNGLFLHCRAGFEGECATEILARAAALDIQGQCRATPSTAHVVFETPCDENAAFLHRKVPWSDLVFTRQWFVALGGCKALPVKDRVSVLVQTLAGVPGPAGALFLETTDTNDGKALSGLCRKLSRPLQAALHEAGLLVSETDAERRIHACFLSGTAAYGGYAEVNNSAPWPMGVPRLKFPRGAPSRSTLKLEEAFLHFLGAGERERALHAGALAVDLGAAPGGWTWQLVRRHMRVTAVDNGSLDVRLLDTGLVTHVRGDGFRFRPAKPVAWMVCDIIGQPLRIAALAAKWVAQGWCQRTIFNLKLPMKQRFEELQRCLDHVHEHLRAAGVRYRLACKQLYHDREEVTVYVTRTARGKGAR